MALYTLSVVAPEKLDRKISRVLNERYHKRFGALPENAKNLNLLANRYSDAFLMSFVGDNDGLARLQSELLDSTNPSNSQICERLGKVLLMRDSGKELTETANTLADKSIELGQRSRYLHWNHYVKAFAEYRAGNFEESKKWSETVLNAPEDVRKHWGNVGPCWFFKAAALQKSNQPEAAQEAFAMGQKVLQNVWNLGRAANVDGSIPDWLLAKQLEKEISAVLHPPGQPPKEE